MYKQFLLYNIYFYLHSMEDLEDVVTWLGNSFYPGQSNTLYLKTIKNNNKSAKTKITIGGRYIV